MCHQLLLEMLKRMLRTRRSGISPPSLAKKLFKRRWTAMDAVPAWDMPPRVNAALKLQHHLAFDQIGCMRHRSLHASHPKPVATIER